MDNISNVVGNIRMAVKLANCAVDEYSDNVPLFVSGDIGPIPSPAFIERDSVIEEYKILAKTFIEEGLSVLTFESFPELEVIIPAIKYAKDFANEKGIDLFIIVQFAINQFGYSAIGLSARKLIEDASKISEIDAIGFNLGNLASEYLMGDKVDILGVLEINTFNGADNVQINLRDIRKSY